MFNFHLLMKLLLAGKKPLKNWAKSQESSWVRAELGSDQEMPSKSGCFDPST